MQFYWSKLLRSKVFVLYTERIKQPTQIPSSVHPCERRKKASKKGGKVVDIASNISEEWNIHWKYSWKMQQTENWRWINHLPMKKQVKTIWIKWVLQGKMKANNKQKAQAVNKIYILSRFWIILMKRSWNRVKQKQLNRIELRMPGASKPSKN